MKQTKANPTALLLVASFCTGKSTQIHLLKKKKMLS
jgi:hypothetical protein